MNIYYDTDREKELQMKKYLWIALTIIVLSFAFFASSLVEAPKAHAQTPRVTPLSSLSYNGQNPYSTGCANTAVEPVDPASFYGGFATIHLEWSTACQTAWAQVYFSSALASGSWGDAYIISNNTSISYSCNDGGNDYVQPRQRSCYTGMIDDPDGYSAFAKGFYQPSPTSRAYVGITNSW